MRCLICTRRFVLAVQVTHEVLGALGQTEQGLNDG